MYTSITRHGDRQTFLKRARPWLLQTEAENNLILSLADRAGDAEEIYVATIEQNGAVVGCALRLPPRKLVLTRMPPGAVPALAMDVATCYDELPAVIGPPSAAREFAQHWCERRGCVARTGMEQRLYRADQVRRPTAPPPGELRIATEADTGLVASWVSCFSTELHVEVPNTRTDVSARIAAHEMALWHDTQPRTLAGYSGRSPNGVRIGYVYTPPEWRGQGYASACVAALSQHALDQGAQFCCLYTDLANPVSNAIYRRIGYEPVCDATDIEFVAERLSG
jgi:GNAT superfamily N-acetyltransferase